MYTDRVELIFDAGHRLLDYEGNCGVPHGHTYKAEIMVSGKTLDNVGFVLDFTELKNQIKCWIDEQWDHGFLVNDQDEKLLKALNSLHRKKVFVFKNQNPTAEVMAQYLFDHSRKLYGDLVSGVRIWESPNQYAEFVVGERK